MAAGWTSSINLQEFQPLPYLPVPPRDLFRWPDPIGLIKPDGTTVHEVGIYRQMSIMQQGQLQKCCKPASLVAPEQLQQWVRSNIISEFRAARINYYIPLEDTVSSIGIHTDRINHWILLYNLEVGGPDAQLVMYRRPGQQLESDPGQEESDPSSLEEIARIDGPRDCWYLLNSRVFHDVVGLQSPRINIQISLLPEQLSGMINRSNCILPE